MQAVSGTGKSVRGTTAVYGFVSVNRTDYGSGSRRTRWHRWIRRTGIRQQRRWVARVLCFPMWFHHGAYHCHLGMTTLTFSPHHYGNSSTSSRQQPGWVVCVGPWFSAALPRPRRCWRARGGPGLVTLWLGKLGKILRTTFPPYDLRNCDINRRLCSSIRVTLRDKSHCSVVNRDCGRCGLEKHGVNALLLLALLSSRRKMRMPGGFPVRFRGLCSFRSSAGSGSDSEFSNIDWSWRPLTHAPYKVKRRARQISLTCTCHNDGGIKIS